MPNDRHRVEIITGRERRRRYSAEQKFALVDATMQPGMTVSAVARLHGVSPSLLFKWRQLMSQDGRTAVKADEDGLVVTSVSKVPIWKTSDLNKIRSGVCYNRLI